MKKMMAASAAAGFLATSAYAAYGYRMMHKPLPSTEEFTAYLTDLLRKSRPRGDRVGLS